MLIINLLNLSNLWFIFLGVQESVVQANVCSLIKNLLNLSNLWFVLVYYN